MSISEKLVTIAENQEKVFEAGKKSGGGNDAFWDEFQNYGNRTNYNYCFASECWNDKTFKPKYDINIKGYCPYFGADMAVTDMSKALSDCGVVLNTANATDLSYMFYMSDVTKLPTLDLSKATNLSYCVYFCNSLKEIEKIIVTEKQTFPSSFLSSKNLEEVRFEGTIASTITFKNIPLSVESMISIITHLADYRETENEYKYTVTFSDSCWEALENSDYDVSEYYYAVSTWREACGYLCWNT